MMPRRARRRIYVISACGLFAAEKAVADGVDAVIASASMAAATSAGSARNRSRCRRCRRRSGPCRWRTRRGVVLRPLWHLARRECGWEPVSSRNEARSHDNYKNILVDTDPTGTVITRASGKLCRLIDNDHTRARFARKTKSCLSATSPAIWRTRVGPWPHPRRRQERCPAGRPKCRRSRVNQPAILSEMSSQKQKQHSLGYHADCLSSFRRSEKFIRIDTKAFTLAFG